MEKTSPIITLKKTADGSGKGLLSRTLEIYETKTQYKAVLWNSGVMFWKETTKPIKTAKFKKKDMSIKDIEILYGFAHN